MSTCILLSFRKKQSLWSTLLSFFHTLLQKTLQLNTCTFITPLVLNQSTASKCIISHWILPPPNRLQFKVTPKIICPDDTSNCNGQYTQILLLANTILNPWTKTWPVSLTNCNNSDQDSSPRSKSPGSFGSRATSQRDYCSLPWPGLLQPCGKYTAEGWRERRGHSKR